MTDATPAPPAHAAHVYPAAQFRVAGGANQGDPAGAAEDCVLGDVYHLDAAARPLRLMLRPDGHGAGGRPVIAPGTQIGRPGQRVVLRALYTFVAPDGDRIEAALVRHALEGDFVLPLSPLAPRIDYTLVAVTPEAAGVRLTDIVCVAFAAGTMITVAGGAQRPIESLAPGDLVLTRDNGEQPVRHVARATLRAVGAFAPVVIAAGTLGNLGDLAVSPHHRLFVYQRGPRRVAGVAEILIQARHLVDDDYIRRREGGFVDYLSLVFDRHEIVFAEGIACESLLVNEATLAVLPDGMAEELRARFPGLRQRQHFGTEVGRIALEDFGRESLYRFPRRP
ncbi:MAG: Hint domain-containing protein [Rhodobacteraceae bacterium]|nr:Hint domain-containing protein [Paracoccaceae bacterium]